jgi:hypothetical protein
MGVTRQAAAQGAGVTRQLISGGTASFRSGAEGVDGVQQPEFPPGMESEADAANGPGSSAQGGVPVIVNRRESGDGHGDGEDAGDAGRGHSGRLLASFNGLNHRNQRLANGGNQFSLEPPDQGLCVGGSYVVEAVNDVLRVFDKSGSALTGVVDLNTFLGYPAAINRTTGARGPFVTDPSCHFDVDTHRFFLVVLTLDVDSATGAFLGSNHLDIAVSTSTSPLDPWRIYRLAVQDDGTDGTPNHGCTDGVNPGPCIGDYPHIGADRYGFYITTNEYDLFGPEFQSANIYAISKRALAAGVAAPQVVQFETKGAVHGQPGFTIWPAVSPDRQFERDKGGTEYFLSSNAAEEANGVPGGSSSKEIITWALANTRSLESDSPAPSLSNTVVRTKTYSIPPKADQKSGNFPLGQCVNDTTAATPFGPGCWQFFFFNEPAHNEQLSPLDGNDTRMQQVTFAGGKLYGALDTAVKINGKLKAGIFWFVIEPQIEDGGVQAELAKQGYLAVAGNNVVYPAIGITSSGKGVMAFTLVGEDHHPSAAYATISAEGVGGIQVAAEGQGTQDGFSGYAAFGDPPRPRWGDYGAAVADGNKIWMASEYIAADCTLQQYLTPPFGSCGGTRTSLANWATRISLVQP